MSKSFVIKTKFNSADTRLIGTKNGKTVRLSHGILGGMIPPVGTIMELEVRQEDHKNLWVQPIGWSDLSKGQKKKLRTIWNALSVQLGGDR